MINTPPQHQDVQPGKEHKMEPEPKYLAEWYRGSGKLKHKKALITGGDSGIGRAVAILFAREGADVAITYLNEDQDAQTTLKHLKQEGSLTLSLKGDLSKQAFAQKLTKFVKSKWGKLNILVNNAAEQHPRNKLTDITSKQWHQTFDTNINAYFYLTQAVLAEELNLENIINTTSVTAYRGSYHLLDYSSTKGAIVSFTRSLSANLAPHIRVNAVAPGPVWTPLIPSSFDSGQVSQFGQDVPMGRPAQPEEIAPSYVFLASQDSSYMTGQVLHPNGGEIVNG